jgi:hypothetical protein
LDRLKVQGGDGGTIEELISIGAQQHHRPLSDERRTSCRISGSCSGCTLDREHPHPNAMLDGHERDADRYTHRKSQVTERDRQPPIGANPERDLLKSLTVLTKKDSLRVGSAI